LWCLSRRTRAAQEPEASAGTLESREPGAPLRKDKSRKQQTLNYQLAENITVVSTLRWNEGENLFWISVHIKLGLRSYGVLVYFSSETSGVLCSIEGSIKIYSSFLRDLLKFYALLLDLLLMENPYDNTSIIFIIILVRNLPSISGIQLSLYLQKNSPFGSKPSELSIVQYITYINLPFAYSYVSPCFPFQLLPLLLSITYSILQNTTSTNATELPMQQVA
jgi:hypothetical protein